MDWMDSEVGSEWQPCRDEVGNVDTREMRTRRYFANANYRAGWISPLTQHLAVWSVAAGLIAGIGCVSVGWLRRQFAPHFPPHAAFAALAAPAFKLSSDDPYPEKAVRGEKGVFVFRYADRQIPDTQSNAAELDAIKEQLRQRKQRELYGNWMTQARNQTEIEIEHALLKGRKGIRIVQPFEHYPHQPTREPTQ